MAQREPDDDDSRQAELDRLLAEYMERLDRGELVDRERFAAEHPDFAGDLYSYFDGSDDLVRLALPAGVAARDASGSLRWQEAPTSVRGSKPGDRVCYFGDYELLEEIARGGMGVVYRARQVSLNRPVALKMILEGRLASPADVERFRVEAEAAANLDNPHIVPIYEIGEHLGQHYFSMKLIDGGSLDDPSVRPGFDQRAIARLVATIARTVHHAHQRGILHRDLKPANILIDADGRPHLTDFGLARPVGGGLSRSSGAGIAGTPSYMAPEQASGRCRELTTAVDVYGIGAILYELLGGRPPFQGDSAVEIIWRVVEQAPEGLRARNRSVHRDLETICLKCLEKEPARRYQSAEVLAEDLERWLAHEPIRARPVGAVERLTSWCRRQPALAVLALAVFGGFIGVATQWRRAEAHLAEAVRARRLAEENMTLQLKANRDLRLANEREATARRRAQGRFDAALRALGGFEQLTRDAALLREPRMQGLRGNLLRAMLAFYRELQESLEEDARPAARSQLSAAYGRVADISWELGLSEEALATHRRALALVEQMAVATPDSRELRAKRAQCYTRIGFTLRTMGRPAEALPAYERAREIQEALVRDQDADPGRLETLSWTLSNIGVIHQDLGRPAEAIRRHRQAIGIHEGLVARDPGNTRYRSDLAWCWHYYGISLAASGDLKAALHMFERATAALKKLNEHDPAQVEDRWRLARCREDVGMMLLRRGQPAEAAVLLDRAAEAHRALARDNPALRRIDVIRSELFAACHRAAIGQPTEALTRIRRAEALLDEAPLLKPGMLYDLACAYSLWSGSACGDPPPRDEREARSREAMTVLRRAVAAGNNDPGRIRRDPLFVPLRPRRDFQELLMDLSFPADVFVR
jgi:serine/threonine-protein kinase